MNSEKKRVTHEWNNKINLSDIQEYEEAYELMYKVDELFEDMELKLESLGYSGIGYTSMKQSIEQSKDNHDALIEFTGNLVEYIEEKLDKPLSTGLDQGATHIISKISLDDFQTYNTGSLQHGYYDHGKLYNNTQGGYPLTFKDFLGISGNGAEDEGEYTGGPVTQNDNYVRRFAELYRKEYEEKTDGTETLEEYLNQMHKSGEFIHKRTQLFKQAVSEGLSLLPVASQIKNFIDMAYGRDMITGDEFTFEEQREKTIQLYTDIAVGTFSLGSIGEHFSDEIGIDEFIKEDYNFKIDVDDVYKKGNKGGSYAGDLMNAEDAVAYSEHW